jgi:RNA polymerase sigma-70 factor (ECF subfamily)
MPRRNPVPTNHIRTAHRSYRQHHRGQLDPAALSLLHHAQLGDRDAYAELHRTFREPVTRYVTVRMRDRDRDAIDDLVQDAFTSALAELPTAILDVRGWFIIQAAEACTRHDWSRRRYTRAAYALHEQASRTTTGPTPAEPATRPRRATFVHAMARLTADQRRAIQLRYLDGYPRDAAASLMDRSIEAVRCLERRAIVRLQAALVGCAGTGCLAVTA